MDSKLRNFNTDRAIDFIAGLTGGEAPAKATLDKLAVTGGGPPFKYFGRARIYEEEDLRAWVAKRMTAKVKSTADTGPPRHRGRPRKCAMTALSGPTP
jgi:hypothetical protein